MRGFVREVADSADGASAQCQATFRTLRAGTQQKAEVREHENFPPFKTETYLRTDRAADARHWLAKETLRGHRPGSNGGCPRFTSPFHLPVSPFSPFHSTIENSQRRSPWRPDLNQTASTKTGAVQSFTIRADLLNAFLELSGDIVVLVAIRMASNGRWAALDYGPGKIENFGALLVEMVMFLGLAGLGLQLAHAFYNPAPVSGVGIRICEWFDDAARAWCGGQAAGRNRPGGGMTPTTASTSIAAHETCGSHDDLVNAALPACLGGGESLLRASRNGTGSHTFRPSLPRSLLQA